MVSDDAPVLYEMWSDPEHHLITNESPMLVESLAARRAWLEKAQAEPDVRTSRFTAETIADGTVIGMCNLWGLDALNGSAISASHCSRLHAPRDMAGRWCGCSATMASVSAICIELSWRRSQPTPRCGN